MTPAVYPLFSPPIDLSRRARWTRREARAFFDWFLAELPHGAARAREYLGVDRRTGAEQQLEEAGERLAELLRDPVRLCCLCSDRPPGRAAGEGAKPAAPGGGCASTCTQTPVATWR